MEHRENNEIMQKKKSEVIAQKEKSEVSELIQNSFSLSSDRESLWQTRRSTQRDGDKLEQRISIGVDSESTLKVLVLCQVCSVF